MPGDAGKIGSLRALLQIRASETPAAPAIVGPGAPPMTYGALCNHAERLVTVLREHQVGTEDRVALALPEGAGYASACIGVAAGSVAVPLNPNAEASSIERIVRDSEPKLMLVSGPESRAAQDIARKLGIEVLDVALKPGGVSGEFELPDIGVTRSEGEAFGSADSLALLLSTSGTSSSRAKLVPLTHGNIFAAAAGTSEALSLSPHDRGLNLAVLFHAHGLVAGVISTLMVGAQVMCPPAFNPAACLAWLDEFRPTWITAVPTVHEAVLAELRDNPDIRERLCVRVIRCASAFLPNATRNELERVFKAIVVESYGLTEAMQFTNTPQNPALRKVGSLGLARSSGLAIMDSDGVPLPAGNEGEICVRGPVVIKSYWRSPEADADAFRDGWFRTGDTGFLDGDGHLFLTGRLKDLINRGGEKVAPQEVEAVLLDHVAVEQAIVFGLPHPSLGEEVAAAVVLKEGGGETPQTLRRYAAGLLADFKVPRRIFLVKDIPSNATGKLLRRTLAAQLESVQGQARFEEPRTALERALLEVWRRVFVRDSIGIDDDFFELGGHSLLAVRLCGLITTELRDLLPTRWNAEREGSRVLEPTVLWQASTVRQLAAYLLESSAEGLRREPVVPIRREGKLPPFFMLSGDWAGFGFYVRNLARHLQSDCPVWALAPHDPTAPNAPVSIPSMAEAYIATLKTIRPNGPYFLGGYSHSGLIAFEMASRLEEAGDHVCGLFIVDTVMPHVGLRHLKRGIEWVARLRGWNSEAQGEAFEHWRFRLENAGRLWKEGLIPMSRHYWRKFRGEAATDSNHAAVMNSASTEPDSAERQESRTEDYDPVTRAYLRAIARYCPDGTIRHDVTLVTSREGPVTWTGDPALGWQRVAANLSVVSVPGGHQTCLTDHIELVASHLDESLRRLSR
jgi:oxalate---CoA ligase